MVEKFREGFVAKDGKLLVSGRIIRSLSCVLVAVLSGDMLVETFEKGLDIHAKIISEVLTFR